MMATFERLFDGAVSAITRAIDSAGSVFQERPWLVLVAAVVIGLFVVSRSRR